MIKKLNQVTCSLNLGNIYSVDYSFDPKRGARITLFFITENGVFPGIPQVFNNAASSSVLSALQPCKISIGSAQFIVYPISYEFESSNDKKILKVEFWDDNFKLDNYYIVLGGRGCGPNTFSIGKPFQYLNPTSFEEQQRWVLQQFTSFVDLEYGFNDFITVMRKIFPVSVRTSVDAAIQRNFTGNFREVLEAWCSYLNLSYFFENGTLIIYDPVVLQNTLTFPTPPDDVLSLSFTESLEGTYSKASSIFLEADGGQFNLSYPNSPSLIDTLTMFPAGSRFNDPPITIDNNQVLIAGFGAQFYFVYNYLKKINVSTVDIPNLNIQGNYYANIGVTDLPLNLIQNNSNPLLISMLQNGATNLINFNQEIFTEQFNRYFEYGRAVAGRFYQTSDVVDFTQFNGFTFQDLAGNPISLTEFSAPTSGGLSLNQTAVIEASKTANFEGLQTNAGVRYIYQDNYPANTGIFSLTSDQQNLINDIYKNITEGLVGAQAMDTSSLGLEKISAFVLPSFPVFMDDLVNAARIADPFKPRYTDFAVRGFKPIPKINQENDSADAAGNYFPAGPNLSPAVPPTIPNFTFPRNFVTFGQNQLINTKDNIINQNGSWIVRQNGDYVAYYPKLSQCVFSANGVGNNVLNHRFFVKSESVDVPILFKLTAGKYGQDFKLQRDIGIISSNIWQQQTQATCGARTFTTKNMNFSLNYFYELPSNFITVGLVGLKVEVNEKGLIANYNFSNSVVGVVDSEAQSDKIERAIRNSIKRQYYIDHFKGFN